MNIDERLEVLAHTVELLAGMQLQTEKNLQNFQQTTEKNLTALNREMRQFRHFVLAMGANFESRLIKLEYPLEDDEPSDKGPAA